MIPLACDSLPVLLGHERERVVPQLSVLASLEVARQAYERTDYDAALATLDKLPITADTLGLSGMAWFRKGKFDKASDQFEQAVKRQDNSSEWHLWLGRAYGRRAESGNPLRAPFLAGRARDEFERAVSLDPKNLEAASDLLSYYLEAPGFLGGGLDKAQKLADERIRPRDAAEYQYALSRIAQKRQQPAQAEAHLRKAAEIEPRSIGRLIDLGRYLASQGRLAESDAVFKQASDLNADSPKLLYARARTLVETKRNFAEARALLERYLRSVRTPEDPTPEEARQLMKKAGGS